MTTHEQNALFNAWLEQHAAVLHHVASGFADGADRDDLMQELMLAVWRAIPLFRGGAQTSTFVYRVAHNTALTWHRSRRRYRDRVDRFEALATPGTGGAAGRGAEPDVLERVYTAIRQLPPLDRSLIMLHLDGLSYRDIAELHGLTESNVGARLTRLKQTLTHALEALIHELR